MFTSNRTIKWIENLADQELLINSGERVSIDICTTKDEVLTAETAAFVRELFHHFDYLIQLFNRRVNHPSLQIKLLRYGERIDGFCLVRNQMRLALSLSQSGAIQLKCDKMLASDGISGVKTSVMFSGLVEAEFGSFHDLEWTFLGSVVTAEQVARHHLTEFIQVSRSRSEML
jgi:hypothetical protein